MLSKRFARSKREGAATVEFAFAFIVLMMFVFAIFEYGRALMLKQLADNAARQAARLASANAGFVYNTATSTYVAQTLATSDIQQAFITGLAGQTLMNASNNPLTLSDINVYRADPITGLPMTDARGSLWTSCTFGESIAVSVNVKYDPMLPSFGFLTNPDPIKFICLMRSEANN